MDEIEYIDMIDAAFPYDDEGAWKAIIDQGVEISDNAAYVVLLKICGAPSEVPVAELERMLECWSSKFEHPAKPMVLRAARTVIHDISLW